MTVAEGEAMRHAIAIFILIAAAGSAQSARKSSHHEPEAPAAPPSEAEFTGCKQYPDGKRFRLSLRGEVGIAELATVVSGIGCRSIILGPAVAARAGKVTIDAPDFVTAP